MVPLVTQSLLGHPVHAARCHVLCMHTRRTAGWQSQMNTSLPIIPMEWNSPANISLLKQLQGTLAADQLITFQPQTFQPESVTCFVLCLMNSSPVQHSIQQQTDKPCSNQARGLLIRAQPHKSGKNGMLVHTSAAQGRGATANPTSRVCWHACKAPSSAICEDRLTVSRTTAGPQVRTY